MTEKYVLFLAGGRWQFPWFSYLKDKGHKIILIDPNENPPCKSLSDHHGRIDVTDVAAIKDYITDNQFDIQLVTGEQTDVSTIPVAQLSAFFNTPHIPLEIVQKFTDKYISREHAKSISTEHVPAFSKITSAKELETFVKKFGKSCIVKPSNAQSSRGIGIILPDATPEDIEVAYNEAAKFGTNKYIIAEELVKGVEITVEGMVQDGKHRILGASRKKHFRPGIASELAYPLKTDEQLWQNLERFHNEVIESTGIQKGITHTEYFIDETTKDFWLIEMACRGGGSLIPSHITPWVSGFNMYDLLYQQYFTSESDISLHDHTLFSRTAILHFFEFAPGKVESIKGVDEARKIHGVHLLDLEFKVGHTIYHASDDRGRQGFVILLTENDSQAQESLEAIYNTITVTCS